MPRVLLSDEERAARIRASKQKWAKRNAEYFREYQRKWYAANKDKAAQYRWNRRHKDHEAYKEYRRQYYHTVIKPERERLKAESAAGAQ